MEKTTTTSSEFVSTAPAPTDEPRLGIDIGRVIIAGDGADTRFFGHDEAGAMATPAVAGAFEAVAALVRRFQGRVWLVSKCGARVEARTRRWLDAHRFFERTGLAPTQLRFCRERREKADHARALGLTHFIDDRLDVLGHLEGLVRHRFLFGPQLQPYTTGPTLAHASDWRALLNALDRP